MIEEKEEFLTCKYDAIFKTVVIDQNNPKILEAILSNILGGKPKIISWPRTFIPKTNANEKSKEKRFSCRIRWNIYQFRSCNRTWKRS